jgi:hypothetical protein
VEKKEKDHFCAAVVMAVIVLGISVWAFVMNLHTEAAGGVVDKSGTRDVSATETSKGQDGTLDVDAIAQTAIEKISFDTELAKMEDSVVESMITKASEDTQIDLYMGEGTCADELLFITVADESDLDGEVEALKNHLSEMQQSFQDYLPKEAKKIDDAVILQWGRYVVACVSGDKDNAKKVLTEQMEGTD